MYHNYTGTQSRDTHHLLLFSPCDKNHYQELQHLLSFQQSGRGCGLHLPWLHGNQACCLPDLQNPDEGVLCHFRRTWLQTVLWKKIKKLKHQQRVSVISLLSLPNQVLYSDLLLMMYDVEQQNQQHYNQHMCKEAVL